MNKKVIVSIILGFLAVVALGWFIFKDAKPAGAVTVEKKLICHAVPEEGAWTNFYLPLNLPIPEAQGHLEEHEKDVLPEGRSCPKLEPKVEISRPQLTCGVNKVKFEGHYRPLKNTYVKFIINGREPEVFYGEGSWWTGELTLAPKDYAIRAELWQRGEEEGKLLDSMDGKFTIKECEQEPVPVPTPEPKRGFSEAGAPTCSDSKPLVLPSNVHVIRNGSDATVNFFTQSTNANIYYRTSGQPVWQHALRDIPVTNGYVSVTIHDLVPTGDYDFGIQSANSCAGGEVVLAVVEDDYHPRTFMFSWWEWKD